MNDTNRDTAFGFPVARPDYSALFAARPETPMHKLQPCAMKGPIEREQYIDALKTALAFMLDNQTGTIDEGNALWHLRACAIREVMSAVMWGEYRKDNGGAA